MQDQQRAEGPRDVQAWLRARPGGAAAQALSPARPLALQFTSNRAVFLEARGEPVRAAAARCQAELPH